MRDASRIVQAYSSPLVGAKTYAMEPFRQGCDAALGPGRNHIHNDSQSDGSSKATLPGLRIDRGAFVNRNRRAAGSIRGIGPDAAQERDGFESSVP